MDDDVSGIAGPIVIVLLFLVGLGLWNDYGSAPEHPIDRHLRGLETPVAAVDQRSGS